MRKVEKRLTLEFHLLEWSTPNLKIGQLYILNYEFVHARLVIKTTIMTVLKLLENRILLANVALTRNVFSVELILPVVWWNCQFIPDLWQVEPGDFEAALDAEEGSLGGQVGVEGAVAEVSSPKTVVEAEARPIRANLSQKQSLF